MDEVDDDDVTRSINEYGRLEVLDVAPIADKQMCKLGLIPSFFKNDSAILVSSITISSFSKKVVFDLYISSCQEKNGYSAFQSNLLSIVELTFNLS